MKKLCALIALVMTLCSVLCGACAEDAQQTAQASASVPQSVEDMLEKGLAYLQSGEDALAVTAFTLALRTAPDNTDAMLALASVALKADDTETALAYIHQAIAADPLCGAAYLARMMLTTQTDPDSAWQDAQYALVCGAPPSQAQYAALGLALYGAGSYGTALEAFEKSGEHATAADCASAYRACLIIAGQDDKARALGLSGARDAALDKVRVGGTLTLRRQPFIDASADYHVLYSQAFAEKNGASPSAYTDDKRTEDGLYDQLVPSDAMQALAELMLPLGVSPDGQTLVFSDKNNLYMLRGDIIRVFEYNASRGVPDAYGKLERAVSLLARGGKREGLAWSEDGRYFVPTDMQSALINMQLLVDLLVFDTQKGEYFLGAAFDRKMMRENGGAVVQACFDETGRGVYYVAYGNMTEHRFALWRYDIDKNESALCYTDETRFSYPRLCRLSGGRLLNMADAFKDAENALCEFAPGGAMYTMIKHGGQATQTLSPYWLDYSANSDYGVMLSQMALPVKSGESTVVTSVYCLSVISEKDEFSGQKSRLVVDAFDAKQARLVPYTEKIDEVNLNDGAKTLDDVMGLSVLNAQLSPDGYWALLVVKQGDESRLLLLDLETLALFPVSVDSELVSSYAAHAVPLNAAFSQGLAWTSPDTVLMCTKDGTVRLTLQVE